VSREGRSKRVSGDAACCLNFESLYRTKHGIYSHRTAFKCNNMLFSFTLRRQHVGSSPRCCVTGRSASESAEDRASALRQAQHQAPARSPHLTHESPASQPASQSVRRRAHHQPPTTNATHTNSPAEVEISQHTSNSTLHTPNHPPHDSNTVSARRLEQTREGKRQTACTRRSVLCVLTISPLLARGLMSLLCADVDADRAQI
jgi:hypothetical protein